MSLTKKEVLLDLLKEAKITSEADPEMGHGIADRALLSFIDDEGVKKAFEEVIKWYA